MIDQLEALKLIKLLEDHFSKKKVLLQAFEKKNKNKYCDLSKSLLKTAISDLSIFLDGMVKLKISFESLQLLLEETWEKIKNINSPQPHSYKPRRKNKNLKPIQGSWIIFKK